MYYKIFAGIIFIFIRYSSEEDELKWDCEDIFFKKCINYLGPISFRSSIWDCPPLGIYWRYDVETVCFPLKNGTCPDFKDLTSEMIKYYPPFKVAPSDDEMCSYTVKDILEKAGKPITDTNKFTLSFDESKRELTLFTDIDEKYVRCFARMYGRTNEYHSFDKRSFKYKINLAESPQIYFCVLFAPTIFAGAKTENVVAYSNKSPNQYISDIKLLSPDAVLNVKSSLDVLSNDEDVKSCKTIDWFERELNYVFFYCEDLNLISVDVIQDFLDMHFSKGLEDFFEYLRNKYYCPTSVTTANGIKLHWYPTVMGSEATQVYLCFNNNRETRVRRCEGNFSTGAVWSKISDMCAGDTVLHDLFSDEVTPYDWKCSDIDDKKCINYLDPISFRSSIWDCPFLGIYWEYDFETICLPSNNSICPDFNHLTYEMIKYYSTSSVTPPDDEICSYTVKEIVEKAGKPINESNKFTLSFDENKRELTLFTDIDEKYVRCFATSSDRITEYHTFTKRASFEYKINLVEEPQIYFCVLFAPAIFTGAKTQNVIAYLKRTPNLYISDMKLLGPDGLLNVTSSLDVLSNDEGVKSCKSIDFYGQEFFFYCKDLNLISLNVIKDFLNTEFSKDLEDFVEYLRNKYYCPPNITKVNGRVLHWNMTLVGRLAWPHELCFDNRGMTIFRICEGDFSTGAIWSEPPDICYDEVVYWDLFAENVTPDNVHCHPHRFRLRCLNQEDGSHDCSSFWHDDYKSGCSWSDETICLPSHIDHTCPDINDLTTHDVQQCYFWNTTIIYLPSGEEICSYKVKELLQIGKPVTRFTLAFDRNKEELILFTDIPEKYITCYVKSTWGSSNITFTKAKSPFRYQLEINEEPNGYFCVVMPTVFIKTETDVIVAYTSTTSSRYISKLRLSYFSLSLNSFCNDNPSTFTNCKLIKVVQRQQYNQIFYFHDLKHLSFDTVQHLIQEFLESSRENITMEYLRNIDYCLPDITMTNGIKLHWNTARNGTWTTPQELCLDNNGMPVTRRCEGDIYTGAVWSEPSGVCSGAIEIPDKTSKLYDLTRMENITEVFTDIIAVTDDFTEFTPTDVNLLSDGLKTVSNIKNVSALEDDFLMGISNAMRINSTILRESQKQLNSTDKTLDSIENFVLNIAEDITNSSTTIQSNVLTHITCPFMSNRIGLALYRNGNDFHQYNTLDIKFDQTFKDLPLENLDLAVYVPSDFIRNITNNLTAQEKEKIKIINTVFYNDGLFNDVSNENRSAGSRVINVRISGLASNVETPINILFRPVLNFANPNCAFWDYGGQKLGEWSTLGGELLGQYEHETLFQCTFDHITHFALLVLRENIIHGKDDMRINPLAKHELILSVITLIGCGLSFIGILIMLVSALIFKGWYKKRLNLIQLALVLLMEITVLFVADLDLLKESSACMAIGALLHYIILSKFIWILIITRLQYLKFVKIIKNLQAKSHTKTYMIIGWVLPTIPVILAVSIFPDSYTSGNLNFCYAKGYTLYFFLILPASAIILINIGVFSSVMVSVSNSMAKDYGANMQKLQLRLGVMLFFMLGITWIFGILTQFLNFGWAMLVLIYLFCILAPLQGFVLFLFNGPLDKTTATLWKNKLKIKSRRSRSYDVLQAFKSSTSYEMSTRSEVSYFQPSQNITLNHLRKRDSKPEEHSLNTENFY